jgi:uncharacterized protein (TIGR03437 family)
MLLRLTFLTIVMLVPVLSSLLSTNQTIATPALRRITNTSEHGISLNPSISGDGTQIAFESTEDVASVGGPIGFRVFISNLSNPSPNFTQIARTRAVAAAVSQDGFHIAFASAEDPLGTNQDRNSEMFISNGFGLRQLTQTTATVPSRRLIDGSFQPSISDDGNIVVFTSNRDLTSSNPNLNSQVFLFEVSTNTLIQLTSIDSAEATDAKISGDGNTVCYVKRDSSSGGSDQLVLYNRVTTEARIIATYPTDLRLSYGRAISDSGRRIVFSASTGPNQTQVFLFDAANNSTVQITTLAARLDDVALQPTISGDGKRVAFATCRDVIGSNSDRSVELYVYDIPTAQFTKVTDAPRQATAEVVSSMNDDGSVVVFNFPRVLSGPVSADVANNCEIYLSDVPARPQFGALEVLNAAALDHEPSPNSVARESIAVARGHSLAYSTFQTHASADGTFPSSAGGTTLTVNGHQAQILFVSPERIEFVVPAEMQGSAEIIATNADGFQSRTTVEILQTAPGVFSTTGDGSGAGLILNADSLSSTQFDPTDGRLRLIVFATGVRHGSNVQAFIENRPLVVESVNRSDSLPGLDEVRVLIASYLAGMGIGTVKLVADERESNPVTVELSGSFLRDIMLNEILIDPPDGIAGDANHDGTRSSSDDEFVELVNRSARDINLEGYELWTRGSNNATDVLRHRFSSGTVLAAGTAAVVFGGGAPNPNHPAFGGASIFRASSGGLSLTNSGGLVLVKDPSGSIFSFQLYGNNTGLRGDLNQSITRSPDITGSLALHQVATGGASFSPGTRLDGTRFNPSPAISRIVLTPQSTSIVIGGQVQFRATALSESAVELEGVIFNWTSGDNSVASIDASGTVSAVRPGSTQIFAAARGERAAGSLVTVVAPSPSPSPTISPTPSPSPVPNPSPAPTPTPSAIPAIVISEFRTRGPNGASDEFIELYNPTNRSINIGGWKIRASSSSGTLSTRMIINDGVAIGPNAHFLATNLSGYSGAVAGDQTFSSGIANDGGIAITDANDAIVDQVGMSAGSGFREGMHLAPLPSDADQSYERRPGGSTGSQQDTNDNFTDFRLLSLSDPQNLASNPTPNPSPSPPASPTPTISPAPSPSPSPSPPPVGRHVVVSQVYGGGGNTAAPFRNDFIEIFNAGTTPVSMVGWSVQYASATGTSWSVTNLNGTLAPGQYYLVQEASGGSSGATLPTPDAVGTVSMAASSGKVALVTTTTALSGACPVSANIGDLVGYGPSASCFRGNGPTAAPGNTTAVVRRSSGCTDTGNNLDDFVTGSPVPRNTTSTLNPCTTTQPSSVGRLWPQLANILLSYDLLDVGRREFQVMQGRLTDNSR